jgi:hypothetical protein
MQIPDKQRDGSKIKDDGLVLWSLAQQYFSYIMAGGFSGTGNWNTRRKPSGADPGFQVRGGRT